MPELDQLREVLEKEREEEHLNVRAVDVGIGKNADLPVAESLQVGLAVPRMRINADRERDVVNRVGAEKRAPVDFPSVENLAPKREHRLKFLVAPLLGGAPGGVALHDEEFVSRNVARLAVGELPRKNRHGRRAAALVLRGLALTRLSLADDVFGELFAVFDMVVEPELKLRLHEPGNELERIAARELLFRLPLELRIDRLRRKNKARAAEDVFGENLHALCLKSVHVHEGANGLPETVLEARFMGAALRGGNEVHIAFAREGPFGRPDHHPCGAFARRIALGRFVGVSRRFEGFDHRFAVDFRKEIFLEAPFVLPVRLSARAFIAVVDLAAGEEHRL